MPSLASVGIRKEIAKQMPLWQVLHTSLNATGTTTLRFSSSNPNSQNISKQEIEDLTSDKGKNLRYIFGPAPGREWWSCDAENIELRIPAYTAGEEAMIDIFEHPERAPYFGSYHLLIFDLLHPEKFAQYGIKCKEVYADTWYTWTKNGNFSIGYGSVERSGTADRAYHVPGAFGRVKKLFSRIHGPGGLNDQCIAHATKHGYVETLIDRSIGSKRGYPLYCSRSQWGKIKPTTPLNYLCQGSAMAWMCKAMIRTARYCQELTEQDPRGFYPTLQVHDEIVMDFPAGTGPEPWRTNLAKIKEVKRLMELGGIQDYGFPTPVSCKYHPNNWGEAVKVDLSIAT